MDVTTLTPRASLAAQAIDVASNAVAAGDQSQTEQALRAALEAVSGVESDADVVLLLNELIRVCMRAAAYSLAEAPILRLLDIKREKGEDHPEVATVLASLATVRQAQGRHEDAERLWRQVLAIRERTMSPNHFSVVTALEHLAESCAARGNLVEALQLSQRALAIREATLGPTHASLRNSRERIADFELQASEDLLDLGHTRTGQPSRPLMAPTPETTPAARSAAPLVAPARASDPAGHPAAPPRASDPASQNLAQSKAVAPAAAQRASDPRAAAPVRTTGASAPVPVAVKPDAYLKTLELLRDEVELAPPPSPLRVRAAMLLAQHRVAAIAGVSVLVLPFAAWGIVGSVTSERSWSSQNSPRATVSGAATSGVATTATIAPAFAAVEPKDSSTTHAPTAATVVPAGTPVVQTPRPLALKAPTLRRVNVSLDSIAAALPAPVNQGESPLHQMDAAKELAASTSAIAGRSGTRARMIGALPTPRYPAQQLRGRTGGFVRVRFDVDTLGRPIMSTFSVVSTPVPQLGNAVREVIPSIRFEPARTAWPDNRPIVETVELTFLFTPTGTPQ